MRKKSTDEGVHIGWTLFACKCDGWYHTTRSPPSKGIQETISRRDALDSRTPAPSHSGSSEFNKPYKVPKPRFL